MLMGAKRVRSTHICPEFRLKAVHTVHVEDRDLILFSRKIIKFRLKSSQLIARRMLPTPQPLSYLHPDPVNRNLIRLKQSQRWFL